jgi:hypothetical protein
MTVFPLAIGPTVVWAPFTLLWLCALVIGTTARWGLGTQAMLL